MTTPCSSPASVILVDGENIDWALSDFLGTKPEPDQRPRWERLLEFTEKNFGDPCRALFFVNATSNVPQTFISALRHLRYTPIMLTNDLDAETKVVDLAIQKTLNSLRKHPGCNVLLVSHDGDFFNSLMSLADGRRLAIVGFHELVNSVYHTAKEIDIVDLEHDVDAFNPEAFENGSLPRQSPIPLSMFEPNYFIN